jgi:hypothetical protein
MLGFISEITVLKLFVEGRPKEDCEQSEQGKQSHYSYLPVIV